jgi:hypothetical protein
MSRLLTVAVAAFQAGVGPSGPAPLMLRARLHLFERVGERLPARGLIAGDAELSERLRGPCRVVRRGRVAAAVLLHALK